MALLQIIYSEEASLTCAGAFKITSGFTLNLSQIRRTASLPIESPFSQRETVFLENRMVSAKPSWLKWRL
jgi:hypothetical protein